MPNCASASLQVAAPAENGVHIASAGENSRKGDCKDRLQWKLAPLAARRSAMAPRTSRSVRTIEPPPTFDGSTKESDLSSLSAADRCGALNHPVLGRAGNCLPPNISVE